MVNQKEVLFCCLADVRILERGVSAYAWAQYTHLYCASYPTPSPGPLLTGEDKVAFPSAQPFHHIWSTLASKSKGDSSLQNCAQSKERVTKEIDTIPWMMFFAVRYSPLLRFIKAVQFGSHFLFNLQAAVWTWRWLSPDNLYSCLLTFPIMLPTVTFVAGKWWLSNLSSTSMFYFFWLGIAVVSWDVFEQIGLVVPFCIHPSRATV